MFKVFRLALFVATIYLFTPKSVVYCSSLMNRDSLRHIRMCDNQLEMDSLPNQFFAELTRLQAVSINNCRLSSVPGDLFMGSPYIRNISLANNHLSELPANIFDDQPNLMNLDLSYNEITELDDSIFSGTLDLAVLRLSHNRFSDISSDLISGLSKLRELYLDNNNLHTIHMNSFDETSLQILHLQNNLLTFEDFDRESPFQTLHQLEILNMQNNSIKSFLYDWHAANSALRELDLSYNQIKRMDFGQIFNIWSDEIKINLSNNQIATLRASHVQQNEPISQTVWILNDNPLKCDCLIGQFAKVLQNQSHVSNEHTTFVTDHLRCSTPHHLVGQRLEELSIAELTCSMDNEENMTCPQRCSCYVRTFDRTAIFNCSNANLTEMPLVPNYQKDNIQFHDLYIENNNITSLAIGKSSSFDHINRIFAKNNSVERILAEHLPVNLYALDLSANKLKRISLSVLHKLNFTKTLESIALGQNPFICDCDTNELKTFIIKHSAKIIDITNLICDNDTSTPLTHFETPLCPIIKVAIGIGVIVVISIVALLTAVLYYKNKLDFKIWLFANRKIFSWLDDTTKPDDHTYDAFILYASADEEFVAGELVPQLENGSNQFKICMLVREFKAGDVIPDKIIEYVNNSRRTVIVLTANYIDAFLNVNDPSNETCSEPDDFWGLMGFRVAHHKALQDRRSRVIIIKKGDIGNTKNFQSDLKAYFNTNVYLRWDDNGFVHKLSTAIAHPEYFKTKYQTNIFEVV